MIFRRVAIPLSPQCEFVSPTVSLRPESGRRPSEGKSNRLASPSTGPSPPQSDQIAKGTHCAGEGVRQAADCGYKNGYCGRISAAVKRAKESVSMALKNHSSGSRHLPSVQPLIIRKFPTIAIARGRPAFVSSPTGRFARLNPFQLASAARSTAPQIPRRRRLRQSPARKPADVLSHRGHSETVGRFPAPRSPAKSAGRCA